MSQRVRSWLIPVLACFTLVTVLWIPFGFKVSGIMEEWLVLHSVEHNGPSDRDEDYSLFITTGTQRMRPLVGVAPIMGYELSPDSFTGFNLVTMALFVGKGIALYLILRKLVPKNRAYAILVALLFVVYPADSGLFTFRSISIHLSVLWYLLGTYLFLIYFQSGRRWALIGTWLTLIGSVWIYEIAYPLIALTPLLLIWMEGRLNRRVVRASLLLFVAPLVALLYVSYLFVQGASYQSWVLQHSGLNQSSVIGDMVTSMISAYNHHFWQGWIELISQLGTPYVGWAVIMGAITFGAGWLLTRNKTTRLDEPKRRYWILALIGFAVVGIGYAPFLITPYRQLDWRVYYYSSIGGAICLGSVIYLLVAYIKLRQVVFVGVMSVFVGLATLHSLNQHEYYDDLALTQQQLLHGVVTQVPHLKTEAPIVVVDETGTYNSNWSLGASYLVRYALDYVYGDDHLTAALCSFDSKAGKFIPLPEQDEQCTFTPMGVSLTESGSQTGFYPYDQMVLVRYTSNGAELLKSIPADYLTVPAQKVYNPDPFVDSSAPLPHRFYTMFSLAQ